MGLNIKVEYARMSDGVLGRNLRKQKRLILEKGTQLLAMESGIASRGTLRDSQRGGVFVLQSRISRPVPSKERFYVARSSWKSFPSRNRDVSGVLPSAKHVFAFNSWEGALPHVCAVEHVTEVDMYVRTYEHTSWLRAHFPQPRKRRWSSANTLATLTSRSER